MESRYKAIISVDIGTTTMRSCVFDEKCQLTAKFQRSIELIYSQNEDKSMSVEMDPQKTWDDFIYVIKAAKESLNHDEYGLALCTQRNTFISWNVDTLEPCHNLITWKDGRANKICEEWNDSFTIKMINMGGSVASMITRSKRFKAASVFKFLNAMVSHRFLVELEKNPFMQSLLKQNKLRIGALDTWLMCKLSNGKSHVADRSCASSTGLYDPFNNDWGYQILKLIKFPPIVLPKLVKTAGEPLAVVDENILKGEIKVLSSIGDAQSGIVGAGVTSLDYVKVSLGTGTFVNILTKQPHPTFNGVYPLVAWDVWDQFYFTTEARSNDTATCLTWAKSFGLYEHLEELNHLTIDDKESGLHFIPAFSGIQTPIDDGSACCAFMGIKTSTTKRNMLYAVLISIAFRVKHIYDTMKEELTGLKPKSIRVCGGVSNNPIICQCIADLIGIKVERVDEPEYSSSKGAALLAGVTAGMWNLRDISNYVKIERVFEPSLNNNNNLKEEYKEWLKAVERCLKFYDSNK